MTNQQGAPEALPDPSPDKLRAIARTARNSSGSASDDCGPLAYVLHGWRAAAIAFRAQQATLVEAQQLTTHVQNPAEIEHVAGDVSKNGAEVDTNVYAELPPRYYLAGGVEKTWDQQQMCVFADATHALRAQQPAATGRIAELEDAARLDFLCSTDKVRMIECEQKGLWRVYQDEAPPEAVHHHWQAIASDWHPTPRAAIDAAIAARKQGANHD